MMQVVCGDVDPDVVSSSVRVSFEINRRGGQVTRWCLRVVGGPVDCFAHVDVSDRALELLSNPDALVLVLEDHVRSLAREVSEHVYARDPRLGTRLEAGLPLCPLFDRADKLDRRQEMALSSGLGVGCPFCGHQMRAPDLIVWAGGALGWVHESCWRGSRSSRVWVEEPCDE